MDAEQLRKLFALNFPDPGFRPVNVTAGDEAMDTLSKDGNWDQPRSPTATTTLPQDSKVRKTIPLWAGVFRYFPAALAGVARVSQFGNDKHNGKGTPLQHTRGLSMDHYDCLLRHLADLEGGAELDPESGIEQYYYVAWRALAAAQELAEEHGAPLAPGAHVEAPF